MSALVFLLLALVISGVGSLVLVVRNRRPTSVESGIDEFRREMNALAPPRRSRASRSAAGGSSEAGSETSRSGDDSARRSASNSPADPQPPRSADERG